MNKNKFFVSGAAALGLSLALQSPVCAAGSFAFDPEGRRLDLDCALDSPEQPFANVLVLPREFERSTLSDSSWQEGKTAHRMVYTTGGNISEDIELGSDFAPGEYILYLECGSFSDRSIFAVTSASLSQAAAKVNRGESLSDASFGADADVFAANKTEINLLVKNAKPTSGYTAKTFLDSYMQASGLAQLMRGSLTLSDFTDLYEPYFGDGLNVILELSESEKTAFVSAIADYDIADCTAPEVIDGALFVADCKGASEQYKLLEIMQDYIESKKLPAGDYEDLDTLYASKARSQFKDAVASLDSAEKIYDKYIEICAELYDDQKDSDSGSSGGSGGGGGGSSSGRGSGGGVSLPVQTAPGTAPVQTPSQGTAFGDISGHWSEAYVKSCVEAGIINGYTDNTFRPDSKITRAETASLISKLFELSEADTDIFADVAKTDWYRGCVSAAYTAGVINGYNDGTFRPDSNITRQDMAVMLCRALEGRNIAIEGSMTFTDGNLISDYAADSVGKLAANGIITGYNNLFRPEDELTRGEAAALIYRIMTVYLGGAN